MKQDFTFNATIKVEGVKDAQEAISELAFLLEQYGYFETAKAEVISIDLEHDGKTIHI